MSVIICTNLIRLVHNGSGHPSTSASTYRCWRKWHISMRNGRGVKTRSLVSPYATTGYKNALLTARVINPAGERHVCVCSLELVGYASALRCWCVREKKPLSLKVQNLDDFTRPLLLHINDSESFLSKTHFGKQTHSPKCKFRDKLGILNIGMMLWFVPLSARSWNGG